MKPAICALLGIEIPLVGFSYSTAVVAEVSSAGGCGVLGAALMNPEELDEALTWIDKHSGGRSYGVDLIVPNRYEGKGDPAAAVENAQIPPEVHRFVDGLLRDHDIDPATVTAVPVASAESMSDSRAAAMVEVALRHPVSLLANALGTPPPSMIDAAKAAGVPIGALVGTPRHAIAQADAGLDFIVAQGSEAGGHTGQVGTMVIVPEVIRAVREGSDIAVLAAGGIATGRQMAAAIALGADGVWTGSVWLTTDEAETAATTKEKMLAACSTDTVRSKFRTGKPSRQLRSTWHEAWEREGSPDPLPMPLMNYVSEPALRRADVLADGGHEGARRLATYWVGQTIGLVDEAKPVRDVMATIADEYVETLSRLARTAAPEQPPAAG